MERAFVEQSQTHHRFQALFGELMCLKLHVKCWLRKKAANLVSGLLV
jgi:hypothetical protein